MTEMPITPIVTVAICTYNRADCIADAIHSSFSQETSFEFEVLVVDNNSTDSTAQIVHDLQRQYSGLRYCLETQQGLSYARNRALDDAAGQFIAYIDDDCVTPTGWLENVYAGFSDSRTVCVGGKIVVGYPDGRPNWLHPKLESFLGHYDLGPDPKEAEFVYGGNIAVRKDAAIALGGFHVDLGYSAENKIAGEDIDFCHRVRKAGFIVWYVPDAWLIHNVKAERTNKRWFLEKARNTGLTQAKMMDNLKVCNLMADVLVYNASAKIFKQFGKQARAFDSQFRAVVQKTMLEELINEEDVTTLQLLWAKVAAFPLAIWHVIERAWTKT